MDYADFLAEAMTTGRVLTVGPGSTLGEVEDARLGANYVDDIHKSRHMMRRDYGFMEFSFRKDLSWVCTGVAIQVHRLVYDGVEIVPPVISEIYGPFPLTIPSARLMVAIHDRGQSAERRDAAGAGFVCYSIVGLGNNFFAIQRNGAHSEPRLSDGDVWAIYLERQAIE